MLNKLKHTLNEEHEGVVAFEYVIVLISTAMIMFASYAVLGPYFKHASQQITDIVTNMQND